MGWVILFICSVLVCLTVTSFKKWNQYWYAGLITMVMIYAIDSTLITLGAFSYRYPNQLIGQLPTLYWLSSFFGGIILVNFYPQKKLLQFPYVLLSSLIFLLLELVMYFFGYIFYDNWSPVKSYFLDIFGLIIVIWLWNWMNESKIKTI